MSQEQKRIKSRIRQPQGTKYNREWLCKPEDGFIYFQQERHSASRSPPDLSSPSVLMECGLLDTLDASC